jgi:Flp pilus assembly protein TadG
MATAAPPVSAASAALVRYLDLVRRARDVDRAADAAADALAALAGTEDADGSRIEHDRSNRGV